MLIDRRAFMGGVATAAMASVGGVGLAGAGKVTAYYGVTMGSSGSPWMMGGYGHGLQILDVGSPAEVLAVLAAL